MFVGQDERGRPVRIKAKGLTVFGEVPEDWKLSDLTEDVPLDALWELGERIDLKTASELLFSTSTPQTVAAIFRAALNSPFFRVEGDRLVPRSEGDVKSLLEKEKAQREEKLLREELDRILKGDRTPLVDTLRAIYRGEREDRKLLKLIDEDFWRRFANAGHLQLEDIPSEISDLMEENLGSFKGAEFPLEDMRDLLTFSIDDEETEDVDDAISLIPLEDGYELFIHIALPYVVVGPESEANVLARSRGATLYLPDGRWHMFPREAVRRMSLLPDEDRASLTLRVKLHLSGEIESYEFIPALVRNNLKLNYRNADEVLENLSVWRHLVYIKNVLRERRLKAGGVAYETPFVKVRLESGEIIVSTLMPNDAMGIVSELMILYNYLAGEHLAKRGFVGIFRVQEEYPPKPLPSPSDPLYFYKLRSLGKPLKVTLKAGPHRGLGIPYYIRATSPIRRYSDVLNQHQILASLKLLHPISAERMERYMAEALAGELKRHKAQKHRTTFVLLHHLRSKGRVVGIVAGRKKVFIPELLMELQTYAPLRMGRRYLFRVKKVKFGDATAILEPIQEMT